MVQIYAPEKNRIGKHVNLIETSKNYISDINSIDDVSILKQIYDEVSDFTRKLIESNENMNSYKYDKDIQDAINENEEIIKKKKGIIELIEKRFKELRRDDLINNNHKSVSDRSKNFEYL